jgi:UDP-N-acetyl-D-mannosaminuronate dehydrogenase
MTNLPQTATDLKTRIASHDALVGIIGLGYVGLPLALALSEERFTVLGFDVDPGKIDAIATKQCYIKHLDGARLNAAVDSGRLTATTDFDRLAEPDAILICVPTPLTVQREPDMRYVEATAREIATRLRPGQLIILESTTYPGTTEELVRSILEAPQGGQDEDRPSPALTCGSDFFLAFSPEREDPGNPNYGTTNTPKVVGGVDEVSGDLAQLLYDQIISKTVRVSTARAAEAAKLTENIFRAVNIALVNELKMVYDAMGIDVWEVLDAAATKPFGFMRFNPGPGWGGHCIAGHEWLRVRGAGCCGVYRAKDLFKRLGSQHPAVVTPGGIYVDPDGLEALALDPDTGEVDWFPVKTFYRGRFEGNAVTISTQDRRQLTVTDEHPMLVWNGSFFAVKPADSVAVGDVLPLLSDLGDLSGSPVVDLIDVVAPEKRTRVWVRIPDCHWSEYEEVLKSAFGWTIRDSIRSDALRLDRFLEIEHQLNVNRIGLRLLTGMGPARREWPATITCTPDVARLLGYYLAEGCITEEKNATRVRWTFNRDEAAYIEDVASILQHIGFQSTRYDDATWHSTTLKVSSLLLASLLDAWGCGRRSEEMRIPELFFSLSPDHKIQLLTGLLRGDGDVWAREGESTYVKNGREYTHQNATAVVGYFSSSPVLLEQVVHLMQDLGFQPRYKKGLPQIRIQGAKSIEQLAPIMAGAKGARLDRVKEARRRRVTSLSDQPSLAPGLRTTQVACAESSPYQGWVYSMEVEQASTFTTSSGIGVHNCIPLDPFYLAWKAREYGTPTRFIELAGEVNVRMPDYVVSKLTLGLNSQRKAVNGAKILILGLAYKKDIDDPRESPAFEIIDLLLELGADLSYHDPYIPTAPTMRTWPDLPQMHSVDLTPEALASTDAVVVVTDHTAVDYDLIAEHAPLIVDTRGVYRGRNHNITRA